ncbi:MAG TPA: sigma-54 dependent transcriptional regulator [Candidatus Polarisedimenticolia bacterium]|nr:sigma-54 dependent transcriptional regulator [Candidatus Polarisedimenticolia bacterium]
MAHLLIVDDERSICELLEISFRKEGHRVEVATNGEAAKRRLAGQMFDIVVSDICMPDMDGVELLRFCKEISPATTFILITGVPTLDTAIDAVNFGADRYVIKGDRLLDELRPAVQRVAESLALKKEAGYLRRELRRLTGLDHIIGTSPKMRAIFELIENIAPQSSRVLITGESGTGKELVARAIHENSARAKNPFITINCGAFPETLLESELFGYLKGAFTGANENRRGLFQAAHGGTLFMDEIGNMSVTMQVKLYRVLQEGKVRPIGSTEESDVDVRVIAATNKDLEKEIAEARFREDLYYRLSVIPIHLPPLRERHEDIPLLAREFLERFSKSMGKRTAGIEPEAMRRLEVYDWPGHVRELENTIERAVALENGSRVSIEALPDRIRNHFQETIPAVSHNGHGATLPAEGLNLEEHIQEIEKSYLLAALERSGGVRTRAAELLKMSYRSFRHYAKKYSV